MYINYSKGLNCLIRYSFSLTLTKNKYIRVFSFIFLVDFSMWLNFNTVILSIYYSIGDNRNPRGNPKNRWIILIGYPTGFGAGLCMDIINGYGFTKTQPKPDPLPSLHQTTVRVRQTPASKRFSGKGKQELRRRNQSKDRSG